MIVITDFLGTAAYLSQPFPGAIDLTPREYPPQFFERNAPAEMYDAEILSALCNVRPEARVDALPRLHTFLHKPRSIDEVITMFLRAAEKEKATKPFSVAQQLRPWMAQLGDMAYAKGGPAIGERHSIVRFNLSILAADFARMWFTVWVIRQQLAAMCGSGSQQLSNLLVIPQGDFLFAKQFSESTASQAWSLSQRVLSLQRFGWGIIVLSHQPSELDVAIQNACAIPVCFA